jgi:hypothetical protein
VDVEERVDHLSHGGTDGRRLLAHIADERERGKDGGDRFDPEHQHGGEEGVRVRSRSICKEKKRRVEVRKERRGCSAGRAIRMAIWTNLN